MIHSLFLEFCASKELASRLLFVVLTVCVIYEALPNGSKRPTGGSYKICYETQTSHGKTPIRVRKKKKQGPVATFDSYVLAAVCALSFELQLFSLILKNDTHSNPTNSVRMIVAAKTNGVNNELQNGICSAVRHTRRILEALFLLKPSSVGTSWSYSSNGIVAAAMVAAHVSDLFRRSKSCITALSVLMRCKLDDEISGRASSLYHLIDIHGKTVASIVNQAEPLEAHFIRASVRKDESLNGRSTNSISRSISEQQSKGDCSGTSVHREETVLSKDTASEKCIEKLFTDTSDLANFLTADHKMGNSSNAQAPLRSVLGEQELCFSAITLLWHKLIAAPETQLSAESTSGQQGWRQVQYDLTPARGW